MAGRDYPWLVASIKSWTRRSDLATVIPDLVMLAEERMSADLEARGIDTITTMPTAAGAATLAIPPEVIEIRSIGVPNNLPLKNLSADAFNARYSDSRTGIPVHYVVIGDQLYLGPKPDVVYQLAVSARKTLPPLTDANPTNWLILRNPSLYLAAALVEAMINLRDDAGKDVWEGKYAVALNTANSTKVTAGDLTVRTDVRTR